MKSSKPSIPKNINAFIEKVYPLMMKRVDPKFKSISSIDADEVINNFVVFMLGNGSDGIPRYKKYAPKGKYKNQSFKSYWMFRLSYFCKSQIKHYKKQQDHSKNYLIMNCISATSPLTPSQIAEISEFESFLKNYSEAFYGERIAEAYFYEIYKLRCLDESISTVELSRLLSVPRSTMRNWIDKFKIINYRYFEDDFSENMLDCL